MQQTAVLDAWSCSCCDNAQRPTTSSHRKLSSPRSVRSPLPFACWLLCRRQALQATDTMALVAALRVLHAAHAMNALATLATLMCVVRWAWRLLWRLAVLSCCTWHDIQLRVPRLCFTASSHVKLNLWAQKNPKHIVVCIPVRRNSGPISRRTGTKLGVRFYAYPA